MKTSSPRRKRFTSRPSSRAPVGLAVATLVCVMSSGCDFQAQTVPASATCGQASPGAGVYCAPNVCGPFQEGEGDRDPGLCAGGIDSGEEGGTDHCQPVVDTCSDASPDDDDYCAPDKCGPCLEGEGDCDPGQCAAGLECVEEGATDRCRPATLSNLQVNVDGEWRGVCCSDSTLEISDALCWWTVYDRTLTDETAGLKLDCPEGGPTDCECNGSGERMHGIDGDLDSSIMLPEGGPVYSDHLEATCVTVNADGELETEWTHADCLHFRFR